MISKERLKEFKKIWKEEFGEEINDKVALERGTALMNFFEILTKWDREQKLNEANKEKENQNG